MPAPGVPVDPAALAADPVAAVACWHAALPMPPHPVDRAAIDALARRAATHQGEARTRLLQRLQAWMAAPSRSTAGAAPDLSAAPPPPPPAAGLQALSALVDRLGRVGPKAAPTATAETAADPAARRKPAATARRGGAARQVAASATALDPSPAPLKAMAAFSGTWSRLRAEQRLRQALAQVPAQAGPLNSSQLVYRTLRQLHALSPAYLDAFMAHIDTLLALEQATGLAELNPSATARSDLERRAGARRARKP